MYRLPKSLSLPAAAGRTSEVLRKDIEWVYWIPAFAGITKNGIFNQILCCNMKRFFVNLPDVIFKTFTAVSARL
jgi:hypothetical protein